MFYKVFNPENETKTLVVNNLQFVIPGRDYIVVDATIATGLQSYWAGFEIVEASQIEKEEYDNKLTKVAKKPSDETPSDEKEEIKYVKPKRTKK